MLPADQLCFDFTAVPDEPTPPKAKAMVQPRAAAGGTAPSPAKPATGEAAQGPAPSAARPQPEPFYRRPAYPLQPEDRSRINAGILKLLAANAAPAPEEVFQGYTGRGGLSGLERGGYENRHQFTRAKHELEKGQFFTPDWVAELAAKVLRPAPGAIVCDPTCGHGAFWNWFKGCCLVGNDVDPDATAVARHVFPHTDVKTQDLCVYEPPLPCDCIVGNPPYGLRWTTHDALGRASETTRRSEDVFLEFIARHLKRGGSALFVVPADWPNDPQVYAEAQRVLQHHFIVEGEFFLPEDAFAAYGCERIRTKLFLIRTKLEADEPQRAHPTLQTAGRTVARVLEQWAKAGQAYETFRQKARALRAQLTLEQARAVQSRRDRKLAYRFQRYVFHLSRLNRAAADHAWQRWAEAHRPPPDGLSGEALERWHRKRLRPETVVNETRKLVRDQHRKPRPLVRLTQTKTGLKLVSYGPAAAAAIAHQTKAWTWLALEHEGPDLNQLRENLARLNAREDAEPIVFKSFHWQRAVRRQRHRLAAWRQPLDAGPSAEDRQAAEAAYEALAAEYGLPIQKRPQQIEKLAQVLPKPGALLAWQQGTGKTLAALAYAWVKNLRDRRAGRCPGAALVVASALAVELNWLKALKQAGRHTVTLERGRRHPAANRKRLEEAGPGSWAVLTHDQAHQNRRALRRLAKAGRLSVLILDEADEFGNPGSQRCRAVRAFANKIRHRLLTTGTPARNTAAELFNLLDIAFGGSPAFQCVAPTVVVEARNPETKGPELVEEPNDDYLEPYAPVRGHGLFQRCHAPARTTVLGQKRAIPDVPHRERLAAFLATVRSRLTLEELLGYNPLAPRVVRLEATPEERALYQEILKNTHQFLAEALEAYVTTRKFNQLVIAQAIRMLQQACSIPRTFKPFTGASQAKHQHVLAQALSGAHARVAVGTLWVQAAAELEARLKGPLEEAGVRTFAFTGEASMAQRQAALNAFQQAPRALLITTQAALRSSVNVLGVTKVIAEALPWNLSALGQWARRFVRLNCPDARIELDLLVTADTIEERILGLNLRKEDSVALLASGDRLEEDPDATLEEYGVSCPEAFTLLVDYLAGQRDESLNVERLKKALKDAALLEEAA